METQMDFLASLTSHIFTAEDPTHPAGVFHMTQVEPLPVTSAQIQKESNRDPILSKAHELTVNGWPAHGNPAYLSTPPDETSYQYVMVAWVLESLRTRTSCIVKMNSLARSYVWWPGTDCQVEDIAKTCSGCQQRQRQPQTVPLHTWEWPTTATR
ncbi:hypothetical protein N1851_009677 [Merluccius polli]|uniref:Integrase zinc-binding domain-containing protein n=1 Tax=Merluccius polli TaxID=89951 RepID=A0AA47MZM5_MERPO|nr:hypothetical protein N1851_009677 [Merluccius polli]